MSITHSNLKYESTRLYTRRRADGIYGLYTKFMIFKDHQIIDINSGDKQDSRDIRTIETDEGHFMHPEGMFTNHSCNPTAYVDKVQGILCASRDIPANEEITFNYLDTETELALSFSCKCGAIDCVGEVSK